MNGMQEPGQSDILRQQWSELRNAYQNYNRTLGLFILFFIAQVVFLVFIQAYHKPGVFMVIRIIYWTLGICFLVSVWQLSLVLREHERVTLYPFVWVLLMFLPAVNLGIVFVLYHKSRALMRDLRKKFS